MTKYVFIEDVKHVDHLRAESSAVFEYYPTGLSVRKKNDFYTFTKLIQVAQ